MNTFRRELLDSFLNEHKHLMAGDVLDIGGKKENKRGRFQPPKENVSSWKYVNIDESTKPDCLCSAENIPIIDSSIDVFLMCEVLEHLEKPEIVLAEAYRLLRPGGHGILTIPFLYPVHGDPFDFQRWTDIKLKLVLEQKGFEIMAVSPMGGTVAVVMDLIQIRCNELYSKRRLVGRVAFVFLKSLKILTGGKARRAHSKITTGYSIIVKKPVV